MSLKRFHSLLILVFAVVIIITCERPNQPPTKPVIVAQDTTVTSKSEVLLEATSNDPDGDPLSWRWEATGGSFNTNDLQMVIWTAPTVSDTQKFAIKVEVSDDNEAKASADIDITVIPTGEIVYEKIVGTKSGDDSLPFDGSSFDYYRYQVLYHGSEIDNSGTIARLSIMPSMDASGIYNNFRIYMAQVVRDELEPSFQANYEQALPELVYYNSSLSYEGQKDKWFDLTLSSPFGYDSTKNLLIEFQWKRDNGKSVSSYGFNTGSTYRSNGSEFEDAADGLLVDWAFYLKLGFND